MSFYGRLRRLTVAEETTHALHWVWFNKFPFYMIYFATFKKIFKALLFFEVTIEDGNALAKTFD